MDRVECYGFCFLERFSFVGEIKEEIKRDRGVWKCLLEVCIKFIGRVFIYFCLGKK